MNEEERNKMLNVLQMIQQDCETDANTLDGLPFTGPVIGKRLGEIYATISTLAKIQQIILQQG